MRVVRLSGGIVLLAFALVLLIIIAAVYLAFKILLWLLPLIIVAVAAWAILYIFNKPPKERSGHIDAEFRIK